MRSRVRVREEVLRAGFFFLNGSDWGLRGHDEILIFNTCGGSDVSQKVPDKLINIFFLVGNGTYWLHHIRGYWETEITACAYSQAFRKCNIKIFYFIPDKMALNKPVFFYLPKNPLKLFHKKKNV